MTNEQFIDAVHKYTDTVYRVALNCLKNPHNAEDVTQEVFLRLYRAKNSPSDEYVKAWLIRVTLNECRRMMASPWTKFLPLEEYAAMPAFSDGEKREIYEAVMVLPAKYSLALYLHYYEGYSTSEMAKLMGISVSAVCSRLERGRKKLRLMLGGENV